jgi:hypothetical protein
MLSENIVFPIPKFSNELDNVKGVTTAGRRSANYPKSLSAVVVLLIQLISCEYRSTRMV